MSRFFNILLPVAVASCLSFAAVAADKKAADKKVAETKPVEMAVAEVSFPGIGRPATPDEIKAWDIDVGPDFTGLPKGSGSVDRGQEVWEGKCEVCHGTFAESNSVFTPLVGGTTADDIKTGHVANLKRRDFPQRTTFMKVATVSTLWDYIHRAMPWNAPKSLSNDDVYAVLAYLLNLAEIVPGDFVLNEQTIRDVQARMPNRNGMTWEHALWPGAEFTTAKAKDPLKNPVAPDTRNTVCMKDCKKTVELVSTLPDYALSSHGNIASQNRAIGAIRGQKTGPDEAADAAPAPGFKLAESLGCLSCHGLDNKIVGPAYREVAVKYKGADVTAKLIDKVKQGGEGVWGDMPMPPQADLSDADAKTLVEWVLAGAPEK